jgi:hypothetical protein
MRKDSKNKAADNILPIITVSGLLYLFGVALTIIIYSFRIENVSDGRIPFIVELQDSCDEADIFRLEQFISKSKYCVPSSMQFIPKEEAMNKIIGTDLKKEEIAVFDENLLPNIIEFYMKSGFADKENEFINDLKKQPQVADVISNKSSGDKIHFNLQRIRLFTSILLIFFIFVALIIIYKSNKLSLLATVDKSAGEKKDFLGNLLKNNIRTAVFCGLFACAALLISFVLFGKQFEAYAFAGTILNCSIVSLSIFTIGIILFAASAKIIINQHIISK